MPETLCSRRYDWFDRLVELHLADVAARAEEREADRREAGVRAWKVALVLPVEVVLLFAGAVAILEWLRA